MCVCVCVSQAIAPDAATGALALDNVVAFERGGRLAVASSCAPARAGGRVDFRFRACDARWRWGLKLALPPVGQGWFEVIYVDDELRLCRDVRGDLQVCRRRPAVA